MKCAWIGVMGLKGNLKSQKKPSVKQKHPNSLYPGLLWSKRFSRLWSLLKETKAKICSINIHKYSICDHLCFAKYEWMTMTQKQVFILSVDMVHDRSSNTNLLLITEEKEIANICISQICCWDPQIGGYYKEEKSMLLV